MAFRVISTTFKFVARLRFLRALTAALAYVPQLKRLWTNWTTRPAVLLRLETSRRSAWELPDAKQIIEYEFTSKAGLVDLSPSFYALEDRAQAVRAHAEHSASNLDNPRGGVNVDVAGLAGPRPKHTPGETEFAFTRDEAHRELRFRNEGQLLAFVARIVEAGEPRRVRTTREQLLDYATERLRVDDREWAIACRDHHKASKWPEQIEKLRRRRARGTS